MVKLYELFEGNTPLKSEVPSNIDAKEVLEKNCSEILAAYRKTGYILVRGLKPPYVNSSFIKGRSRANREPQFMYRDYHKLAISAYKGLGIEANRGNSLFTFGTNGYDRDVLDAAKAWGQLFVIFPVNGFEFSWFASHDHSGINKYPFNFIHNFLDGFSVSDYKNPKMRKYILSKLTEVLDQKGLTDQDIVAALQSSAEILIKGKYYALKLTTHQSFRKILKIPPFDK